MTVLERRLYFHIDWALVTALLALAAMGIVMIYSATQSAAPRLYISQIYALALGLLVACVSRAPDGVALVGATLIDGSGGPALPDAAIAAIAERAMLASPLAFGCSG